MADGDKPVPEFGVDGVGSVDKQPGEEGEEENPEGGETAREADLD